MAGSRLHKLSSIFERVKGLIETKVMHEEDIPFWYHIYKRYPPIMNPVYDQPVKAVPVRPILYPEDNFRAKFHASEINVIIDLNNESGGSVILRCKELLDKGYSMEMAIKESTASLIENVHITKDKEGLNKA